MKKTCRPVFGCLTALLLTLIAIPSHAQEESQSQFKITNLFFESRMGYEVGVDHGDFSKSDSGFRGTWQVFRLDGQICKGLSYSYRQRLTNIPTNGFFNATDWLHLDWKPADWVTLSGGKQVVAIGGFEYDRNPADLYYCSEFWNNIACFQLGASASFSVSENDQLLLQVCNSPMRGYFEDGPSDSKAALNLMWYGSHGLWETMWSLNTFQTSTRVNDKYAWGGYVVLGNRFNFTDWLHLDLDYMFRATMSKDAYMGAKGAAGRDFSIIAELSAAPIEGLRVHLKSTYDMNKGNCFNDLFPCFYNGSEFIGASICGISGGVEYSPVKDWRDHVKVFAVAGYHFGENPMGVLQPNTFQCHAGIKFRLDMLAGINALVARKHNNQ